ncbi:hypothetical protein Hanom_Chr05g00445931 [Helianthus anomalus]
MNLKIVTKGGWRSLPIIKTFILRELETDMSSGQKPVIPTISDDEDCKSVTTNNNNCQVITREII